MSIENSRKIMYNNTMENSADEIKTLKEKVSHLEARLEELITDYRKVVRSLGGYDELLNKHCKILDKEMVDAFDRIQNIELKLFPHMARDIHHLRQIIGDRGDEPENPLDERKP